MPKPEALLISLGGRGHNIGQILSDRGAVWDKTHWFAGQGDEEIHQSLVSSLNWLLQARV
jgi:hypothetical protein